MKAIRNHPTVKPSRLINNEIVNVMSSAEFEWDHVVEIAENFANVKRVQNVRDQLRREDHPVGENFEALALFRRKCSEKDEFFIFSVNNKDLNDKPSHVFKSSLSMAKLALLMDKDTNEVLSNEYAHVDATHTRCRGFKSLTLWVYHPVMRKLLRIAIMEVEQENTENLTKFWQLLNEMLQKVSGQNNYHFNPVGFVADKHHANWNSIKNVFGSATLQTVVSCEFHYKQSVQRHAKKIVGYSEKFINLADTMLKALSVTEFEAACCEMSTFIQDHSHLDEWFRWWYDRRTHIFRAFKPIGAPSSNLAEVGHAKLSSVGRKYMSLLEAAHEDIAGAIRQEAEIKMFGEGHMTGGKGRDSKRKLFLQFKDGMKRARAYSDEIGRINEICQPTKFVPIHGKHRPPEKRRNKQPDKPVPKHTGVISCEDSEDSNDQPEKHLTNQPMPKKKIGKHTSKMHSRIKNVTSKTNKKASTNQTTSEDGVFHLTFFDRIPNLKKCYGCGNNFKPIHKKPPHDLILKHFCHRRYVNKEGINVKSTRLQAAYFHLNMDCARKAVPHMEKSDVKLHSEIQALLTEKHRNLLDQFMK